MAASIPAVTAAAPPKHFLHRLRHRLPALPAPRHLRRTLLLLLPTFLWLFLFSHGVALIPSSLRPRINVTLLPALDARLFRSSLSWFHAETGTPLQDLLAAVPYTVHPLTPLIFLVSHALLSPRAARPRLRTFVLAFGLMNLAAVLTHLCFPTAPPWYFLKYGVQPADYAMKGDPAVLARLDHRYHTRMYHRMYGDVGKLVFGAWPSLHAAWPYLMARFRPPIPYAFVQAFQAAYMLLVWWAAVYLHHHFAADVLGGLLYAELAYRVAVWARVDKDLYDRLPWTDSILPIVHTR